MARARVLLAAAAVLLLLSHASAAPAGGRCFKRSNSSPIQTCEVTPCQGTGGPPAAGLQRLLQPRRGGRRARARARAAPRRPAGPCCNGLISPPVPAAAADIASFETCCRKSFNVSNPAIKPRGDGVRSLECFLAPNMWVWVWVWVPARPLPAAGGAGSCWAGVGRLPARCRTPCTACFAGPQRRQGGHGGAGCCGVAGRLGRPAAHQPTPHPLAAGTTRPATSSTAWCGPPGAAARPTLPRSASAVSRAAPPGRLVIWAARGLGRRCRHARWGQAAC
jgi:hypothetical protein